MFWTKSCTRCGGDLYLEHDIYGTYRICLQCGAIRDEEETRSLVPATTESLRPLDKGAQAA